MSLNVQDKWIIIIYSFSVTTELRQRMHYAASKNNCGECPALRILFCMSKLRNFNFFLGGGTATLKQCYFEKSKMCYFILEPFRLLFNWRPTVRPCCTVINLKTAHLAIFSTLYVHAVKKGPCTVKTLN